MQQMDNFDFLNDKDGQSSVMNSYHSPGQVTNNSQSSPQPFTTPPIQYTSPVQSQQSQQSQPSQQQQQNGLPNFDSMNYNMNSIDQFVESLITPYNDDGTQQLQLHPQQQQPRNQNIDDSPYGLNLDLNKTSNSSSGQTPNLKIEDEFGLAIDSNSSSQFNSGYSGNNNYNNNYDTSAVGSPSAIAPSYDPKRSASISGAASTNNSSSTPFTNPQYFSPQVKPSSFQQQPQSLQGRSGSVNFSKSYGGASQYGTSLNNIVSPASTYDGLLDSPYGSYTGGSYNDNASYLSKSPNTLNSPQFKAIGSIGSPASYTSVGSHVNPKNALSKENKLSRRRELHNAVERRRRDLIKEKIKELSGLIPPPLLYDSNRKNMGGASVPANGGSKEIKVNKSVTLSKTVEYIGYLKDIMQMQDERLEVLKRKILELADDNSNTPSPSTNNNSSNGINISQQQQSSSSSQPEGLQLGRQTVDNTNEGYDPADHSNPDDIYDFLNEKQGGNDNYLQELISKTGGATDSWLQ